MQDKHRQGQQMRTAAERTLQPLFISSFVTSASLPALSGPDSSITVDSGDACTPSSAQCAGSQAQQDLLGRMSNVTFAESEEQACKEFTRPGRRSPIRALEPSSALSICTVHDGTIKFFAM